MVNVGIALGTNLGDRVAELDAAVAFLRSLDEVSWVRESPRLETSPVDCPPGSPPFLNAVCVLELDPVGLPPRELLARLKAYEQSRGRRLEGERNASRPIDLDIIYYGDLQLDEPDLIIPHPRTRERRFVLLPLAALLPDLILPGESKTVTALLNDLA